LEYIVIDGGSTDGTQKAIEPYLPHLGYYISEKDEGIFDAINKGVKLAKGDWVYIMGADDEVLGDGLANLMLATTGYDVVYGNTVDRYPNGKVRFPKSKNHKMVLRNMFCSHQGIVMRRELILELGGFRIEYPLKADFDLLQRAYLSGARFKRVNALVAYFSMDGVSSKASVLNEIERYKILKRNRAIPFPFCFIAGLVIKKGIKKLYLRIVMRSL